MEGIFVKFQIYFSIHWLLWNFRTALHLMIQNGNVDMATNVIELGSNLDLQDSSGR